ncbi:MAG: chemotaxis response regulator protein-glutamate methylesterase [Candidatus Marinimicrobia bacterium]|nr:chemotaxis response regulator protein-glutamate methylesterase [Candidatus Neomarinimicrobiota bacterium]
MKVLIVDDTIFYRKILQDVLETIPGVEVVGSAHNGKLAIDKVKRLKPDLLTLDVEMPQMNGLETLKVIQNEQLDVDALMVSSKTQKGSEITIQALALGAYDFISKPDIADPEENKRILKQELTNKLQILKQKKRLNALVHRTRSHGASDVLQDLKRDVSKSRSIYDTSTSINYKSVKRTEKSQIVAVGSSTGGPNALITLLSDMPENIGVPIVITQHMPPVFTASLAKTLDGKSKLSVKEAMDGEVLQPNTVYIAMGGQQMKIASGIGYQKMIRITDDPPENSCKPSVDYLFRSVSREYGSKVTGVILTGMGNDGKIGMSVMKSAGALTIAQNAETCVVYGMPKAVIDAGLADQILPIDKIKDEILKSI